MNTANTPIILKYKAINLGKFKSTTHYEFENAIQGEIENTDLTIFLNISADRECAKSSPTYWIQNRKDHKWIKPRLTGLFKTEIPNIYKGDTKNGRHKVIFKFSHLRHELNIYFFKDLNYPNYYKDGLNRFKNIL
jgi:hypothetical protein